MTAGEVSTIARRFPPTMGVTPTHARLVQEAIDAGKLITVTAAAAAAKSLMAWEDLGQKDGVKTHALTFYESQADKDAKRGRMIVAKVSKGDRSATAWMVDGEDKTFGALAQAKKLAEEVGMAKAVADGFVEPAAAKPAAAPQPAAPAAPPINSISGRSVPLLVGQRLPAEVIAEEVENRISQFAHQPRVLIRERAEGVLPGASDDDAVAGAVYDGAIYLFRDQLTNRSEVRATLFHELLHYGLRRIFSRAQFIREMRSLYERDAWIKARADSWATSADGCGRRSPAVMAQTTPELGYVKRAIAAIRAFLCKYLPGFANMKLADAEIIPQYILLLLPVVISECLGTS